MSNTPILTTAVITALVSAVIGVLVAFGVPVTGDQQVAIMTLVAVIAPFIVFWVGHNTTTPLNNPTDVDGEPLTRSNGAPAIKAGK